MARAPVSVADKIALHLARGGPTPPQADVEGTIHQVIAITGIHHVRYRGLPKAHLQDAFAASGPWWG